MKIRAGVIAVFFLFFSLNSVQAQAAPKKAAPKPAPAAAAPQATTPAPAPAAVQPAAPASAPPPGYDEAVDRAVAEYMAKNYAEARAEFSRANDLYSNARTLRGLGMVEFEMRHYADTIQHLEQALASPVRSLEGAMRSDTEALLARAKGYVARVKVDVTPREATLVVDGESFQGDFSNLVLEVGDHVLEFKANGRQSEKRRVKASGGEEVTLVVVLPEIPVAKQQEKKPLYKNPWLWTAVGVVVVGAAVGTAVGVAGGGSSTDSPYGGSTGAILTSPGK
ncbi:MAG: tetratricopeptide repeat protein [Myxococcales bacterium]